MNNLGFWGKLNRPFGRKPTGEAIMALAPLYDVTDAAFRQIIAKYGKPDVMFTEFTSADGLCHPAAREKLMAQHLGFTESERPIVAQLFTARPEKMREAAELCASLGFDGIDINFGCPDKTIEKQRCGAAVIKNQALALELIQAAKEGAPHLPISVKTRIGYKSRDELKPWLDTLLAAKPAAITFHLRTREEMSKVPAQWELMPAIVAQARGSGVLILGNGDVKSVQEAREKCAKYGCDGVMLGRAIFGNPWLFSGHVPTAEERLKVLLEHTKLFEQILPTKHFAVMKKHFKSYLEGIPNHKDLTAKLMETSNASEVEQILSSLL